MSTGWEHSEAKGLTKRELIAAMAMQGLCASGMATSKEVQEQAEDAGSNVSIAIAIFAVDVADELLNQLSK